MEGSLCNKINNIGYFCTERQCIDGHTDNTALTLISGDFNCSEATYGQINDHSSCFAQVLSNLNIFKGETVVLLLPKCSMQYFVFLGTLKKQCVIAPFFHNIGYEALADRLRDCRASVAVTTSAGAAKIKKIKEYIPFLKYCLITDADVHEDGCFLSLPFLMKEAPLLFDIQDTDLDTASVLHYTSGSTGRPKGVVHTHRTLEMQRHTFDEIFQLKEDDIYWCTAEAAWVTGSSYGIIAPMSCGAHQVQYTGSYNLSGWLKVLENYGITVWYTAPTALRMMMRDAASSGGAYKGSLKRIYSVGEPLNPEIMRWCGRFFGVDIYDTWFQTETGAVTIANRPGLPVRQGSMGKPVKGINASVRDDEGNALKWGEQGEIHLEQFSSLFVNYLNNSEEYSRKFINGLYRTGDKAYVDSEGYFWFQGRSDDIINTGGHLVSPFEVESAILEIDGILDVAVVGLPDDMLYEKVAAFIVTGAGYSAEDLMLKVRIHTANTVSSIAAPQEIIIQDKIPKNKSGKIMRRLLKSAYLGENAGDRSTIEED